jgi:hypothetical protein
MDLDNMDLDDPDEVEDEQPPAQRPATSTLLPGPIASAISFVTRSSALYLRLGTFIGSLALDGARVTTLTSLEVSRAVIEGILSRAGKDVTSRSRGELGRAEAEGILERSIASLHNTITHMSFAAATGFYVSTTALTGASDLSQQLLSTLDSILGSTESSRAIASIITLIRREFQNPATGQPGEKIGVLDLLVGITGFALLQRWSRRLTDQEAQEKGWQDVVCWDVVILDNGRRADVVGTSSFQVSSPTEVDDASSPRRESIPLLTTGNSDEVLEAVERRPTLDMENNDDFPEASLKERILSTLPPDATVSITSETTTTKTITVEITGTNPPDITPPAGLEIVEESYYNPNGGGTSGQLSPRALSTSAPESRYRVVYRTIRNKLWGTNIEAGGPATPLIEGRVTELPSDARDGATLASESAIDDGDDVFDASGAGGPSFTPNFTLSPVSSPEPEPLEPADVDMNDAKPEDVGFSAIPIPATGNAANQKRVRKPKSPVSSLSDRSDAGKPQKKTTDGRPPPPKKARSDAPTSKAPERKGKLREALRKGSGTTLSSLWNKEQPTQSPEPPSESKTGQSRPAWGAPQLPARKATPSGAVARGGSSIVPARDPPKAPQRGNPNYFSSRDLGAAKPVDIPRSESRASHYTIHERRRDSIVSQTDTYSIHSGDRPPSPSAYRTNVRAQNNIMRVGSEKTMNVVPPSPTRHHRRSKSYVPSIYTLKTNNSEISLVPVRRSSKGIFQDPDSLEQLMRTGHVGGLFPEHHIIRNITRYIKFASASYGSNFMRIMGITGTQQPGVNLEHHYEHTSFSHHTQLPPSAILLSSFVDSQGGSDITGKTNTNVPMVHYISLDHASKAVVLTCRGTLGFEDVLADLAVEYDDMVVRGTTYKVHKGIHASALRLLAGNGARVLATLAAALEEFPTYGVVLTGHSLGAAVVSLLGVMLSEPSTTSTAFVTAGDYKDRQKYLITAGVATKGTAPAVPISLPPGRPIHVYAYGPPATMSPALRHVTRGLITSVINGQDAVPYLSLGLLHDMQAVSLAFKTDDTGAKGEVRARVWAGLSRGFADKWYGGRPPTRVREEEDEWAYSAMKALRASMLNLKLGPPGEVFTVESMPVLQRDAFTKDSAMLNKKHSLGRPATRAVLKYVRDVERRFGELRFGGSMLLDHSPGRYEVALAALAKGVLEG